MKLCKACGSTQKLKPAFVKLGKLWCGHCGCVLKGEGE